MLTIFEPPILITLVILFYFLFFFVLFLTKLQGAKEGPQKNVKTPKEVVKESRSECTMFGFLQELPKDDPIPDECMSCQKLLECLLKKKAFDWYSGQDLPNKNEL